MGLFKMNRPLLVLGLLLSFLGFFVKAWPDSTAHLETGRILFLIQQGETTQAFAAYRQYYQKQGVHDFELIHQMGLGLLDYGFRQRDPEIQLMALFGASVSAHEEAYYILEESLKNPHPQIQLVALQALARLNNDRADQALNWAMGSNYLILRLEAAHYLCKKKHPLSVSQTESLMYKSPKAILPIYPQLYALAGTEQAIRILRKMLNHTSEQVRVAVILSAAEYGRDDLLPQIRQQASHLNFAQQEACSYALGLLKDEKSIPKLKQLARSSSETVALAAQQALYRLGQKGVIPAILKAAKQGSLFAITALGEIEEGIDTLLTLINHSDIQIRLNAALALLEHHHPACLSSLKEILIRDKRDLAFTPFSSPGEVFEAWKVVTSASKTLSEDISAYSTHLELKESTLTKAQNLPEVHFLQLAELIFKTQQNELIPTLVELLEDLGTEKAIGILLTYQQMLGAPLVRQYCNLALYRLREAGPYGNQLRQWVRSQNQMDLIRFRPFIPWEVGKGSYQLTPEETSRLLVESFEAFTINQDEEGINLLIETIEKGHTKNKYALAGLLLRATE